jgi:hypothetical protein
MARAAHVMRTRDRETAHLVTAGVLDAGVASLASFAAGLTGVSLLTANNRGIYGVFFTAFFLGSVIVTNLALVPAQVIAVGYEPGHRMDQARRSLILGSGPALGSASVAIVAAVLTRGIASSSTLIALTTTTAITIVVSPLQDHIRQLLHIAERSWHAVVVSSIQLVSVAAAIVTLLRFDVARVWIPFGSLAIANTVSLTAGVILSGSHRPASRDTPRLTFHDLTSSGGWLVVRSATPALFGFALANIVTRLAGSVSYGYAEAARQVAQPITVLAVGLSAVLGPRAVRAGMSSDAVAARRTRASYSALLVAGAVAYVAIAGSSWSLNPMAHLVPSAYEVSWLVTATIAANLLAGLFLILERELLGAGRARILAVISVAAAPALPIAAATAGATGAFARPIGYVIEGSLRNLGGHMVLRSHYATRAAGRSRSASG